MSRLLARSNVINRFRSFTPVARAAATYLPASRTLTSTSGRLSASVNTPPKIIGVEAAIRAASDPSFPVKPEIFDEFKMSGKVAVVSGGNGDLGLEMSLALAEAGATVYALDLPSTPSRDFNAVQEYVRRLGEGDGQARSVQYRQVDVTDQAAVWKVFREIAKNEGRIDATIAAAGILGGYKSTEYPAEAWEKMMAVNTSGVFYTAQGAAREMTRLSIPGSIVLVASMSGSITNRDHAWTGYNTSKSAVLQMTRSLACEWGTRGIRVNSLSPGHIYTKMTAKFLDTQPGLAEKWSNLNPMGRLGKVHEVRAVAVWLASDASSFCTGSDIMVTGGHHSW